jgi:hypothetical protein
MGANAARLLVDRVGRRDRRTAQIKHSPTLAIRRTTAAVDTHRSSAAGSAHRPATPAGHGNPRCERRSACPLDEA